MNNVEKLLLRESSSDLFQRVMRDKFSFVDSLIEQADIDKYKYKKNKELGVKRKNGSND